MACHLVTCLYTKVLELGSLCVDHIAKLIKRNHKQTDFDACS